MGMKSLSAFCTFRVKRESCNYILSVYPALQS